MKSVTIATINVIRIIKHDRHLTESNEFKPCLDLYRNCGMGCECGAKVFASEPSLKLAEAKSLCFHDIRKQGISEIAGSGEVIKEGPDEWIYSVGANIVEMREEPTPPSQTCRIEHEALDAWKRWFDTGSEYELTAALLVKERVVALTGQGTGGKYAEAMQPFIDYARTKLDERYPDWDVPF